MSWEFQDHLPIYAQLMDTLKRRIVTGRYLPGEKLPSVRELAAEARDQSQHRPARVQ